MNARDAMPDGGVITIGARNALPVRQGELAGDFVVVSVCDTGTGMSADVLAPIFEPFFTTKEVGNGLDSACPRFTDSRSSRAGPSQWPAS